MSKSRALLGRSAISSLMAASVAFVAAPRAEAAPSVRVQLDQTGDFILIGNTLGYECAAGTPAPMVGAVGACGANTGDSAPDVFWRSDSPASGMAEANTGVSVANARSTAALNLPAGATVTHAFLYWGAKRGMAGADTTVTLAREGAFSADLTATSSSDLSVGGAFYYQSVANVTALVQMYGAGTYRVSDVDAASFIDASDGNGFAGWSMVIFYRTDIDPLRNLALFDGLDNVVNGSSVTQAISGFLVPMNPPDGKLGVFVYEGDNGSNGDALSFNGGAALTDAQNPNNNFFNGTRSYFGATLSLLGDLPQLTGGAQSLSGIDIDVVNVKAKLTAGLTTTSVQFATTNNGDGYFVGAFVTSIPTLRPDMSTSTKTAVDVNGGALLPGDTVEYTINVKNGGSDASIQTTLIDPLPLGVTFVPGSILITQGPNMGMKSDMPNDDQGEYDGATRMVKVRLGTGATAALGGSLAVGETTTVKFLVTVDAGASGVLQNQAQITAAGQQGAPVKAYLTDGNGPAPGSPPTPIAIDECAINADCPQAKPFCNIGFTPNTCVECLMDASCSALKPTCDPATGACVCVPTGAELCDGKDNNCDAAIDEGNPESGQACSTGLPGACDAGSTTCMSGAIACATVTLPGMNAEVCGNNVDEDCDGALNNACPDGDGDGLADYLEAQIGTDPNDSDSDDDGALDGDEVNPGVDTDGDGLVNALDADSDNDGLFDGTELGFGCSDAGTNTAKKRCRPDADQGATTTDPVVADSDGGGAKDGSEDANLNGAIDGTEGDPSAGADDTGMVDADGDGLSDALEAFLRSAPGDADSDDDGALDGAEANPSEDTDGDGLLNVVDADSDNDALPDGIEMSLDCSNAATDLAKGRCRADTDVLTKTSPLRADSDGGGYRDGCEDVNLNGAVDVGEWDPNGALSEPTSLDDFDGDGLTDLVELTIGTKESDADTDDDGALDGAEPNPFIDDDADGKITTLDADSDDDGLFDGLELGKDCLSSDTDNSMMVCAPDGDMGATTTSALLADTDFGGLKDADEDKNKNGVRDMGELDPNDGMDDGLMPCTLDAMCGGPTSGQVCGDSGTCMDGCRGTGNGCAEGLYCSSTDDSIGVCGMNPGAGGNGGNAPGAGGNSGSNGAGGAELSPHGGSCLCAAPGRKGGEGNEGEGAWFMVALAAGCAAYRRRR